MTPDLEDTIVALSSASGPGARAIVRLTGPSVSAVLAQLCPFADQRFAEVEIRLPGIHSPLPAALLFWQPPRTYTGQPLAEIHTIGSPPLVELLIAQCLNAGARAARPGEFTMRAFLAGKLNLPRA